MAATEDALKRIRVLAEEIGPRRPCSAAERQAAEWLAEDLAANGLTPRLQEFRGYESFGLPFGLISGAAVAAGLTPRRFPRLRAALALASAAALALEGDLRRPLLSRALSQKPSQNVIATIEPRNVAERTVCLMSHLDSSRSGVMFNPAAAPYLGSWITLQALAGVAQGADPLLGKTATGRRLIKASRLILLAGLTLLIERELRGEDVAGANDNASGVAVAATLAAEIAVERLESTRVIICATGCEEAGTLGAQAFTASRDTSGWLFLNFDSVGGEAPLRYLGREGVISKWDADPKLVALAERVASANPGLMTRENAPAGLTYDTSHVLARGGRALTLSAQEGYIPDLHWPTDRLERIDPATLERALGAGRELVAAIDRGEAD